MNTLTVLKGLVDSAFPTNGTKQITAATLRSFMKTAIDDLFTPAGTVRIWPGRTIPTGWALCDGSSYSQTDYADLFAALGGATSPYGVGASTFNVPKILPAHNIVQSGISKFTIESVNGTFQVGEIVTAPAPAGGTQARFKIISGTFNGIGLQLIDSGSGYSPSLQLLTGGSGTSILLRLESVYNLGQTSGEETHTLTTDEIPSHTHIQDPHTHTIPMDSAGDRGTSSSIASNQGNNQWFNISGGSTTATNNNTGGGLAHNNMGPNMAMNYIIKLK